MNINAAIWGDSGVPTTYIETLPNLSVADLYITTTKFVSENIRAFVFNLEHDKLSVGMKLGSIVEWAKDITLPLSIDPDESQTSILESEDTKIIRFRMKILKLVNASQKQNVSSSTEGANKSATLARNGANATRRKLNPKITELTNLLIEEYGKINAKDLKRLKNISCTKCRNLILTTNSHGGQLEESTEWKVINLPTEYWSEMIDYWVCHPDGESYNVNMERASITGSFDKNDLGIGSKNKVFTGITELVEADQGVQGGKGGRNMTEGHKTIKLGDVYLGLDEANIESTSVVYDTKRIANKEIIDIRCSKCNERLGERYFGKRNKADMESNDTQGIAKLWLHKITITLNADKGCADDKNTVIKKSLTEMVNREILTRISAHATYYFIIGDAHRLEPEVLIWVTAWGVKSYNNYNGTRLFEVFENGIKVMFYIISDRIDDSATKKDTEMIERWTKVFDAEHLYFEDVDINSLKENLLKNQQRIPKPIQTMGDLGISHIFPNAF